MPDAATLGVLQDVVFIVFLALLLGAGVYAFTRLASPVAAWNHAGKVVSVVYEWPDALMAGLLALGLVWLSGVLGGDVSAWIPLPPTSWIPMRARARRSAS